MIELYIFCFTLTIARQLWDSGHHRTQHEYILFQINQREENNFGSQLELAAHRGGTDKLDWVVQLKPLRIKMESGGVL